MKNGLPNIAASASSLAPAIDFGREICGDLDAASSREWLVVNGIGGFASGTISSVLTRRYHGLLFAALAPPLGRVLLVTKVEEEIRYGAEIFTLSANRWGTGAISPDGYRYLERFHLEGTTPVFTYALGDALLEKRIFMRRGENSTYVQYRLARGRLPMQLRVKVIGNHRDYHGATLAKDGMSLHVEPIAGGLLVQASGGAKPYYIRSDFAAVSPADEWYCDYLLSIEQQRGFPGREDHFYLGELASPLAPGGTLTLIATTEANADLDSEKILLGRRREERALLDRARAIREPSAMSSQIQQLVLAADQFIVARASEVEPKGSTVIAGYPWFGDWGRDTMISLAGLTLYTGQPDRARSILRTFSRYIDRGMMPNRFPDNGESPEYNTVDATLYFFEALRAYHAATADTDLLQELWPLLNEIIDFHERGTRHGIHAAPDGLLTCGEPGVQLTWMDAKVGDRIVTPRQGKPVEVNAFWYNALCVLADMAIPLRMSGDGYMVRSARVRKSFARFYNAKNRYCFDVLDGPDGNDARLRPNQIFAVSLPHSPLGPVEQQAVVESCARHLLTSHGLRSLAPFEAGYVGRYLGDVAQRDNAYHQGTVWSWLLGPFALAHYRVYGEVTAARSFLLPLLAHLSAHGLGSISEIFDGDPPHTPRGCIAQAWSVAEWLRCHYALSRAKR